MHETPSYKQLGAALLKSGVHTTLTRTVSVYTVHDRIAGGFPAKCMVYTPSTQSPTVWLWQSVGGECAKRGMEESILHQNLIHACVCQNTDGTEDAVGMGRFRVRVVV
jgi:hypothetical protein